MAGWLVVFILLGLVSLLADVSYEGMRGSVGGLLGVLGAPLAASALLGFGEVVSYGGRVLGGWLAYRYASASVYRLLLYTGYGLNAVVVLMGLVGDWRLVIILFFLERLGKGLRAPVRDVLVSELTRGIGRGKGFGLYEVMDQAGAVTGPLIVAYMLATAGGFREAYLVLGLPVAASLLVLHAALSLYPWSGLGEGVARVRGARLTLLVAGLAMVYAGFAYWPLLAQRMVVEGVSAAEATLMYSLAMGVDAVAALLLGALYDRYGALVVFAAPAAVALAMPAAAAGMYYPAAMLWGVVVACYESVYRAIVADYTSTRERPLAFAALHLAVGVAWGAGSLALALLPPSHHVAYTLLVEAIAATVLAHALSGRWRGGA